MQIQEYIQCHGESTTTEIADAIDADRHTVSKKLQLLEEQGAVTHRQHGPAKLWRLTDNPLLKLLNNDSQAVKTLNSVLNDLEGDLSVQNTELDLVWPEANNEQEDTKCYEHHLGRSEQCPDCPIDDVVETGEKQRITTESEGKQTTITLIPIKDDNDNVTNVAEHMIQW